nr:ATP-dependent Clp protease ATP-binding subunit ClpA homolog CD4B, chloroplastic-like [Tanacetum cinerariifolium]
MENPNHPNDPNVPEGEQAPAAPDGFAPQWIDPEVNEEVIDDNDWDDEVEWLMAPVTPPRATMTVSSTYEIGGPSTAVVERPSSPLPAPGLPVPPTVIEDLGSRLGNLEYRHGVLTRKMEEVSDTKVADDIAIGEIHPRVATIREQVESRVDTHPSGQMAVQGHDVIVGSSEQAHEALDHEEFVSTSATSTVDPFALTVHTGNNEQHHSQNVKTLKDFKGCGDAKQELKEVKVLIRNTNIVVAAPMRTSNVHVLFPKFPIVAHAGERLELDFNEQRCLPGEVDRQKKLLTNGTRKSKRAVKMMCNTYLSPMRMRMFSGLRGSNALDNIIRTGVDFHFKIIASSVRKKRVSQVVPKAMFERFTKKTIKVIMIAQAKAHRLGHNFVGTKHILLGLIAKPGPTEESRKPNVIGWSEGNIKVAKM